jgi:phosphoenolpyruvate-protein kinase (PTS system EI component)
VAREYGIPAVVATGNATVRLHPGQLVTVDGSAGTITPHTEPITDQRDSQRVKSDHPYVADGNVALAHPLL